MKHYIKYFLMLKKEKKKKKATMKDEICLQLNGECACHHLNGPQRVHYILQLVPPQNPVRGKPATQTGRQSGGTPASSTELLVH